MTTYSKRITHGEDAAIIKRLGIGEGHRPNKYHNCPTVVDGIRFDSKAEAERYGELRMLEQAGQIKGLRVHPRFCIVDKDQNGAAMAYEADFEYVELPDMARVILDIKGGKATQTPLWRLKWRLVQARYPHYTFRVEER